MQQFVAVCGIVLYNVYKLYLVTIAIRCRENICCQTFLLSLTGLLPCFLNRCFSANFFYRFQEIVFLPTFRANSHLPISFSYLCSVLWVRVMFHQFIDNSSRTEWIMSNNPTTPFSWRSCMRCHLHRCTPMLLRSRDCLDLTPIHTSTQLHTGPFPSWGSHTAPFWWRLLSPWSR